MVLVPISSQFLMAYLAITGTTFNHQTMNNPLYTGMQLQASPSHKSAYNTMEPAETVGENSEKNNKRYKTPGFVVNSDGDNRLPWDNYR